MEDSSTGAGCSSNEKVDTSTKEDFVFEAETRQLLDIVIHSLYTDKEVFVRELLSNASDALEKTLFLRTTADNSVVCPDTQLEIRIFVNKDANTITIQDNGIGMTKEELIANVGTIARSGSKQFVKEMSNLQNTTDSPSNAVSNIIGQFGVGFYSSFMVGSRVELFTRSSKADAPEQGYWWSSDGSGNYELAPAENVDIGTKVIIH
uniref:Heat shock protein 75 kDa, mitochondrial n=1 Tax=Lygus hesperus TaxID=30085 RepID=A0A0A9VZX7_LYGHE